MTTNNHVNAFNKHGIRLKLRRPAVAAAGMSAVMAAGVVSSSVADAATAPSSPAKAPLNTIVTPKRSMPGGAKAPSVRPPLPNRAGHAKPTVVGTVKSVGSDSFTVGTRSGTETVNVSSSTTYVDGTSPADYSSIKDGERVAVVGSESDGVVTATKVLLGTPPTPSGSRPAGKLAGLPSRAKAPTGAATTTRPAS